MKTALINTGSRTKMTGGGLTFPYGMAMVATALHHNGFQVDVLDLAAQPLTDSALAERLQVANYDIVGFSVSPDNFLSFRQTVPVVRETLPEAKVVAGGPFASVAQSYVRRKTGVVVLPGNGISRVPAAWPKIHQNRFFSPLPSDRETIEQPQTVPRCAYELFPMELYFEHRPVNLPCKRHGLAMSQFGCPFHCGFCASNYQPYCLRDPGRFREEIFYLVYVLRADLIFVTDAEINTTKEHALTIARIMADCHVDWYAMGRTEKIDEELARALAESRCKELWVGVESHAQSILNRASKKTNTQETERVIDILRQAGVKPVGFIVVGLPGETQETLRATTRWVQQMGIVVAPRIFWPVPGSALWEYACGKDPSLNLDRLVEWFSHHNHVTNYADVLTNVCDAPTDALIEAISELYAHNARLGSAIHP